MKFIAKRDFYRTQELAAVEIVGACKGAPSPVKDKESDLMVSPHHKNHFHIGAIIELGKSADESELQTGNKDRNETKQLIAVLRHTSCIGDASDKKVVERVEADVATRNSKLERDKKALEQTDNSDLGDKMTVLMSKLLEGKLAAAK